MSPDIDNNMVGKDTCVARGGDNDSLGVIEYHGRPGNRASWRKIFKKKNTGLVYSAVLKIDSPLENS